MSSRFPLSALCIGLTALAIHSSCKKQPCNQNAIVVASLNKNEVAEVAYRGKDTLHFISETNDTLTFFPLDTASYYNTEATSTNCTGTDKKYQGLQFKYGTLANTALYHNQYVPFGSTDKTQIAVSYSNINFAFPFFTLYYPYTINSLDINGKTYHEVLITVVNTDTLYYSLQKGIIRMHLTAQGKLLQLP